MSVKINKNRTAKAASSEYRAQNKTIALMRKIAHTIADSLSALQRFDICAFRLNRQGSDLQGSAKNKILRPRAFLKSGLVKSSNSIHRIVQKIVRLIERGLQPYLEMENQNNFIINIEDLSNYIQKLKSSNIRDESKFVGLRGFSKQELRAAKANQQGRRNELSNRCARLEEELKSLKKELDRGRFLKHHLKPKDHFFNVAEFGKIASELNGARNDLKNFDETLELPPLE